ncbi:MAG: hypothetical protein O3C40_08000 [Planctomycetota bacterium]|nr:hypothetical protein [Planctomycetota bacterium]
MSHACRNVVFTVCLISFIAGGCGKTATSPSQAEQKQTPAGARQPLGTTGGDTASITVTLDGEANEWLGTPPVWEEAGAAGPGPFESDIDIKQVYMVNDKEHLYVCLRTNPSLQARYARAPGGGELCDLYFDTDNDAQTGCKDVDGFDFGQINGYEMKAWIPVGVYSGTDGDGPFVTYALLRADKNGDFTLSAPVESQSSQDPGALIAHGEDGVEMAIPLEVLGVDAGATVRLLLKEAADPFAKERYSEGTYTLR